MSNAKNATENIWSVDTAGNLETAGCTVTHIIWAAVTASGDDLIFSDTSDNVYFGLKGIQNQSQIITFDPPRKFANLKCNTIDSGAAYVFLRPKEL